MYTLNPVGALLKKMHPNHQIRLSLNMIAVINEEKQERRKKNHSNSNSNSRPAAATKMEIKMTRQLQ